MFGNISYVHQRHLTYAILPCVMATVLTPLLSSPKNIYICLSILTRTLLSSNGHHIFQESIGMQTSCLQSLHHEKALPAQPGQHCLRSPADAVYDCTLYHTRSHTTLCCSCPLPVLARSLFTASLWLQEIAGDHPIRLATVPQGTHLAPSFLSI